MVTEHNLDDLMTASGVRPWPCHSRPWPCWDWPWPF